MKKYIKPNMSISYFNIENITTTVSGAATDPSAEIKAYANNSVRLKQVEFDNILQIQQ